MQGFRNLGTGKMSGAVAARSPAALCRFISRDIKASFGRSARVAAEAVSSRQTDIRRDLPNDSVQPATWQLSGSNVNRSIFIECKEGLESAAQSWCQHSFVE